jgi:NhaA family Na+:H+ antiporter
MTWIACRIFGLKMPEGMNYSHVVTLGMIAAIGFTVALFVSTAAFPPGSALDSVKMGALGSFGAAGLSFLVAKLVGIKNSNGNGKTPETVAQTA